MTDETRVPIAKAKGRPMLQWVGKRPLREVRSFPAQLVERFASTAPAGAVSTDVDWSGWPDRFDRGGLLFHGDNKEVLAHLLANGFRGKVDLVYIDPPFDSGADYVRKVQLRGASGSVRLDGESHTLGEQIQYTDIWANDTYLQFMYERLLLIKELMSPRGSLVLHCDPRRGFQLRCLLDEVLGPDAFVNEVVWKRSDAHSDVGQGAKHLGTVHDVLLLYVRDRPSTWNDMFSPLPQTTVDNWYRNVEEGTGRRYNKADATGPGGTAKGSPLYEWKGVTRPWRFSRARMEELEAEGRLTYSESGMVYVKRYLDESKGVPLQDWWDDIQMVRGIQRRGEASYPTEKPEALLDRVVQLLSSPGDIVLDCFIGSGTTAAVAQKLGRRWIGADINKGAIQTTEKRLAAIIEDQANAAGSEQLAMESGETPRPAQLGFSVLRVNDYDLQIQHNEAVNLAVEHLGADRTKTDAFFQGTLGRELLYIVGFNHPCSPLDLQAAAHELEQRPDEQRDVVVVALGRELACEPWLADYNRVRPINRIRLIELRTDPKYGKFFQHQPAVARVRFEPEGDAVRVTIDDFISPSIIERLSAQEGVLTPQITDWRAMVDSVFIDAAYDGGVFNVALADIPERRQDLVDGSYIVERPADSMQPIAVRITDMLGEEVLVIEERAGH
ncbi:MAG: site-specific DNA-methyltransferase [Chloroflexi bacterium]|nr:site-specific DNA-methyltransferase [Chloroflexota bacterium]